MVLLRTWRREEDGTYIVLYQSTKHRNVRETPGGAWRWYKPVRVQARRGAGRGREGGVGRDWWVQGLAVWNGPLCGRHL